MPFLCIKVSTGIKLHHYLDQMQLYKCLILRYTCTIMFAMFLHIYKGTVIYQSVYTYEKGEGVATNYVGVGGGVQKFTPPLDGGL